MFWVPPISPSSIMFYTGDKFPRWKNNLFVGALTTQQLIRVAFGQPNQAERREGLLIPMRVRIRDVQQSPTATSTWRPKARAAERRRDGAEDRARRIILRRSRRNLRARGYNAALSLTPGSRLGVSDQVGHRRRWHGRGAPRPRYTPQSRRRAEDPSGPSPPIPIGSPGSSAKRRFSHLSTTRISQSSMGSKIPPARRPSCWSWSMARPWPIASPRDRAH